MIIHMRCNTQINYIYRMGNLGCCESPTDTQSFHQFCMKNAAEEYKIYFKERLNKEIHEVGDCNPNFLKQDSIVGDWGDSEPKTGKGVIFSHQNFYYEGDIVESKASGVGKIIWPGKIIYKGHISNNQANGDGQLDFIEQQMKLKGEWLNGEPLSNSNMELVQAKAKLFITFFKNQRQNQEQLHSKDTLSVKIWFEDGITYQGEVQKILQKYKINGNGLMKFSDGSYYQGQFQSGKMHGQGKYFWADTGHWYVGEYKSNFRDGHGTYFYSEQKFRQGNWRGGIFQDDLHHHSNV